MPSGSCSLRSAFFTIAPIAALVASSPSHAVDGVLKAWGRNVEGQTTIPTGLGTVKDADGGTRFTLVVKRDGSVAAWGVNVDGQTTVPSDLGTVLRVSAGGSHSLALLANNSVRAWGRGVEGQATVPGDLASVSQISAGGLHSMALTSAGAVRCWGDNTDGQCTIPIGLGTAEWISAGSAFSLAIKSNGTVFAWGSDGQGQSTVPGDLGAADEVAAGTAHAIALTSLGEVRCWGDNTDGQCTLPGGLTDVFAVAAGGNTSYALKRDGTVIAWGSDGDDQATVPGTLQPASLIAAGSDHALAIEADPTDCDDDGNPDELQIRDEPELDCTGDGELDSCTDEFVEQAAAQVSPFGSASTATLTITNSPTPLLPVEVSIEVKADLGSSLEFLILTVNDQVVDYIFNVGGSDCPSTAQKARVLIPAQDYLDLLDEDGDAVFRLRASAFVSTVECASSFARMSVKFRTDVADCNNNGTPDACELAAGDIDDADNNGVPDTCELFTKGDHNRDNRADLVTFENSTRTIRLRYLNGAGVASTTAVETTVGVGWSPVAQGDFDGDQQPDFLIRNATTGQSFIWLMDETRITSFSEVGYALPSSIEVLAIMDVDGDTDDDIIWIDRNDNKVYAWRLSGSVLTGGGLIADSTGTYFLGAGDIDDDGDGDLLFRQTSTGTTFAWIIENGTRQNLLPVVGGSTLGTEWEGRGVVDVNGDGNADLFLRNKNTGDLFCWFLDGASLVGGNRVGYNPGLGVDVASTQDLDGDGTADLIWRDVNGNTTYAWILNGLNFASGGVVVTLPAGSNIVKP